MAPHSETKLGTSFGCLTLHKPFEKKAAQVRWGENSQMGDLHKRLTQKTAAFLRIAHAPKLRFICSVTLYVSHLRSVV